VMPEQLLLFPLQPVYLIRSRPTTPPAVRPVGWPDERRMVLVQRDRRS
jgi:hypothetical protein